MDRSYAFHDGRVVRPTEAGRSAGISLSGVLRPCDPSDDLQIAGDVLDAWTVPWDWDDISKDMLWLGRHFWATLIHSPDETPLVWHHLVLAVGNFKRQTPIRGIRIGGSDVEATPQPSFTAPGLDLTVSKEDSESVEGLGGCSSRARCAYDIHSVVCPLARLPRRHRPVRLSIGKGEVGPDDTKPLGDQVRPWRLIPPNEARSATAAAAIGRSVVTVERLLYLLRIDDLPGRTWARYGEDLRRKADGGPGR